MAQFRVEEALDVAEVPSGFPVGFCLLTHGHCQYVAFYDAQHRMTVASRTVDSNEWQYHILPSRVGWDSHNYITMAIDQEGYLHLSGNMHCVPLIYFRTSKPGDITTFEQLTVMTGLDEARCTYPAFMRDANSNLIFHYRDGGSGNGVEIYNVYDLKSQTWRRLLDTPLTDGQGKMNAYMMGPTQGPDGWFHLCWVWRDTPDCATNHHLSYARSQDLIHWESASGETIGLPITLDKAALWVDPIPSGGGIINGCQRLAFDSDNRPIITYHKADASGHMQIYAARFEDTTWVRRQLTHWQKSFTFSGNGSMGFIGIKISGLTRAAPGLFSMTYTHRDYGSGRLVIDELTLQPTGKTIAMTKEYPEDLARPHLDFRGIEIRRANDLGSSQQESIRYILQWETLPKNQDRAPTPPLPEPSVLKLYRLIKTH